MGTNSISPLPGFSASATKSGYESAPAECRTCKNRKYQDGSDENVSFKAASHISPSDSGARVRAHEAEHVANAYSKAAAKDGRVLSVGVTVRTAVCPECGSVYTSGGETRSVIQYPNESNPYQKDRKLSDAAVLPGRQIDSVA